MKASQPKVSILTLLYKSSPKLLVFAVIVGAMAGAIYSLIIPFVLSRLGKQHTNSDTTLRIIDQYQTELFFCVCLFILITKASSVILVNNIAKSAVAELRIDMAKKINRMMIANVENIGFPRLLNILTDDVNKVASASVAIPMLLVSSVTVVGMLGYLATLNFYVFLIVLGAIFLGVGMFQVPVAMASGVYEKARVLRDVIQEGLRGLVLGAYELKLNEHKSTTYLYEELVVPQRISARLEKIGDAVLHIAGTASDLLSFFIIGMIVFVLPQHLDFPVSDNYGVVMALLYIAGPIAGILGMMQQFKVGQIALQRINDLNDLKEDSFEKNELKTLKSWAEFSLHAVTYTYSSGEDQDHVFSLKPINLSFFPGQINFIVGGNGSGKSTLSKLLSLHYAPTSGGVYFDKEMINSENILQARARISVIFSNYYLFGKLYREFTSADEQKINNYIVALGLKGKTKFVNGCFTSTNLSDGQRRRLALLVALLEDKDIYIFDEWAADQDPEFKNIFYRHILQDMKRNNKLVVVITHDDRYFDCADRVIFMEDGTILEEKEIVSGKCSESESYYNSSFFSSSEMSVCD
jgi:putative pyoverdin transport system ATP-binding/permease protein